MNRRAFFTWFRTAPVALPLMVAGAMTEQVVSGDGRSLYLGGKRVLERAEDGKVHLAGDLDYLPPPSEPRDIWAHGNTNKFTFITGKGT